MLTVSARAETGLEEGVRGECPGSGSFLKIAKMTEVAFVRVLGIGIIEPRQGIAIVSVDRPIDVGFGQTAENARTGKELYVIIEMPLRSGGRGEGAVGYRLRRGRREPVIADC